ncbi:MAG: SAM-dependent methyltransferase [Streptosporangiaceae bacterium]
MQGVSRRGVLGAGEPRVLDVGTGIPSANNTHEVAQRFARFIRN